jgi:RHS repeat-associated protein
VDASGNVTARYVYQDGEGAKQNGLHQLATRLGANQDTSLPFAGSNVPEFIELIDGSGSVTQRLRLVVNQVGTVQAVVDVATGEVVQRLEHDEFGRVLFDSNPWLQPFGFAGGLVDADTRLVRFGARDYEAVAGRWTARDPVRFVGGNNSYLYLANEPVNRSDPTDFACYLGSEEVTAVVSVGPFDADEASELADNAFWQSRSELDNNQRDALRHCIWSFLMTEEIGLGEAFVIGTIHEDCNPNSPGEREMDEFNNAAGRYHGQFGGNCYEDCKDDLDCGSLQTKY